jgi:GAF domain-containing protein
MDKDHRRGLNSIVDDRETLARVRAELASMTMLNALGNLLTATPDLPSILHEILDATIKLQGADFGDVQLYDEETGTLKIISHEQRKIAEAEVQQLQRLDRDRSHHVRRGARLQQFAQRCACQARPLSRNLEESKRAVN